MVRLTRHPETLLGVMLLGLQLLLAGSGSWHHHDDHGAPEQHQDCSVCVASEMVGQASFEAPALVEAPSLVQAVPERVIHPVSRDEIAPQARGPPAAG